MIESLFSNSITSAIKNYFLFLYFSYLVFLRLFFNRIKNKIFLLKLGSKRLSYKNAITIPVIFVTKCQNRKNKTFQKVAFLALMIEILGSISITIGKFETLAQILAMRFALRSCWRPS